VSAIEINHRGEGICRYLAHISMAMSLAICIQARLVVSYLLDFESMDTHVRFEAFVGDQWHTFDPTNPVEIGSPILLGQRRAAADIALYNQYGPLLLPTDMELSASTLSDL